MLLQARACPSPMQGSSGNSKRDWDGAWNHVRPVPCRRQSGRPRQAEGVRAEFGACPSSYPHLSYPHLILILSHLILLLILLILHKHGRALRRCRVRPGTRNEIGTALGTTSARSRAEGKAGVRGKLREFGPSSVPVPHPPLIPLIPLIPSSSPSSPSSPSSLHLYLSSSLRRIKLVR